MERAEQYFDKKGAVATLLGRLLPGVRHLISIPAGLSKMHYGRFVLYTAIGSALWNATLTLLGWYLHKLVPLSQLNEQVKIYERPILIGLVILVVIVILYFVYQGISRHRSQSQRAE
jgi:membrane protein DedA with SNARE-associated domain